MKHIISIIICVIYLNAQGSAFSKKNDLGIRSFSSNTYTSSKGYGGFASFAESQTNYLNSSTWAFNKYTYVEFFTETGNNIISFNGGESTLSGFSLNSFGWISQILDTTLTIGLVVNPYLENQGMFSEVQSSNIDTALGQFTNYITYSGGINEAKFGVAYEINPDVRVSLDALYYFGSMNIQQKFRTVGGENWIQSVDEIITTYYGLTYGLNAHYRFRPFQFLSAGIQLPKKLESKSVLVRTVQNKFDEIVLSDDRPIDIPFKFTLGYFGKINENWMMNADYHYEGWNGKYIAINKMSVGVEKIASSRIFDSFWNRSIFFLGTYYYNEAFKFNNDGNVLENVDNYGLTVGYSIPFNQNQNRISLSFNFGKRGSLDLNGLSENIFKLNVGLTLQELWYQPEIED